MEVIPHLDDYILTKILQSKIVNLNIFCKTWLQLYFLIGTLSFL